MIDPREIMQWGGIMLIAIYASSLGVRLAGLALHAGGF